MKCDTLQRLRDQRAAGAAVALLTWLDDGAQRLLDPGDPGADLPAGLRAFVGRAQRDDRSGTVEVEGRRVFVQVFNAPLRMAVVGAVHIAQSLAPMATLAGFAVTLIDPRRAFASGARFPGVAVDGRWPDEAMQALAPDARTAVVTLTHDPKLDDPALEVALRSPAYYIGCLGSRRTHAARLSRLYAAGFDAACTARLHGPAGLDLGARSPAEIAVSILAEAIAALRRGDAGA